LEALKKYLKEFEIKSQNLPKNELKKKISNFESKNLNIKNEKT
jgi:hypothetical protein